MGSVERKVNISMPKNCTGCEYSIMNFAPYFITCGTWKGLRWFAPGLELRENRPEWCPLREDVEGNVWMEEE